MLFNHTVHNIRLIMSTLGGYTALGPTMHCDESGVNKL